jgi:hypothetical protein
MGAASVTVNTSFKQYVEQVKGLRFVVVREDLRLYRRLIREFNKLKEAFIDRDEEEARRQARALPVTEEDRLHALSSHGQKRKSALVPT